MKRWVTVAKASSVSELETLTPAIQDVARGTEGRVVVEGLPWISARIFDMALAEQTFGSHLVPQGATVIDCHEEDGIGYVDFEVSGTPVHLILLGIAAALAALGFLAITISVAFKISQIPPVLFSWQMLLIIGLAIVATIIAIILIARKGRLRAGPVVVGK